MKSKRRPTLRDVAREAGVSYQTVSRVINHNVNVSSATRSRVLKTIEALDYHPNRAAQSPDGEIAHDCDALFWVQPRAV
jgi:DNA-binding LacI/PurR family transcriptional regulator